MTSKLLALNVFEDGDAPEQQSPTTSQPEDKTSTPSTNGGEQKTTPQTSTVQETVTDASGNEDGSNLLVTGSIFIGFLVLVLLMLIIIRKLNKQK